MKFQTTYFNCWDYLKNTLSEEIQEVSDVITSIQWSESFRLSTKNGKTYEHQEADLSVDDASMVIVRELWKLLRQQTPQLRVVK